MQIIVKTKGGLYNQFFIYIEMNSFVYWTNRSTQAANTSEHLKINYSNASFV